MLLDYAYATLPNKLRLSLMCLVHSKSNTNPLLVSKDTTHMVCCLQHFKGHCAFLKFLSFIPFCDYLRTSFWSHFNRKMSQMSEILPTSLITFIRSIFVSVIPQNKMLAATKPAPVYCYICTINSFSEEMKYSNLFQPLTNL